MVKSDPRVTLNAILPNVHRRLSNLLDVGKNLGTNPIIGKVFKKKRHQHGCWRRQVLNNSEITLSES